MENDRFEMYNAKRNQIISQYKKKKRINVLAVLLIGLLLLAIVVALKDILNIAVTLVLSAMIIMVTVIFARIRAVTINHTMDSRLKLYEQEEPEFHANFKK